MSKLLTKNLVSVDDLSLRDIQIIFNKALKFKKNSLDINVLKGKVIGLLFFEPSSRTYSSFAAASQKLGAGIISYQGMENSSIKKGESFEDTIKTFSSIVDLIVIRHPQLGSALRATQCANVPIINAGDGIGEHPTQALLDIFTMKNHFPKLSKITVGLAGDLKNGRTVHSLIKLLLKFGVKKFVLVSPKALKISHNIYQEIKNPEIKITESESLNDCIASFDVLYMTRIQKERFSKVSDYKKYKGFYLIDKNTMRKAKNKMILMHPLPRVDEIKTEIDSDKRAVYFKEQIPNGVFIRMSLLELLLK